MNKRSSQYVWAYKPQAPKFTSIEKDNMLSAVRLTIAGLPKLSEKVSRIEMRSNRIYLYELVEQSNPEGEDYIKPLVEGKYLEFPYARITLNDTRGENCTADFQRHNNKWMTIYTGTLTECLHCVQNDDTWF